MSRIESNATREVQIRRAQALRKLHTDPDLLLLANVWDVASARLIADAGFSAIATSSAGIAWSHGYADGQNISREEMLEVVARIARAIDLPVSADLEDGYGASVENVEATVGGLIESGAVGLNLEDSDGQQGHLVYDFELSVERIRAGRAAAERGGVPIVINARTDAFFPTNRLADPLAEVVRRGNAYREAGADCVFVPFVADAEIIRRLVSEIDAPLNVLASPQAPNLGELAALGVARVSIGGAFSRMIYAQVRAAAAELRDHGTCGFMDGDIPHSQLNELLSR